MIFHLFLINIGQNFGRTSRAYKQDSDEYPSASLVLDHLQCIVRRTALIVLCTSRFSYVAYEEVGKWLNDYKPYLIRTKERRYIDVQFNAWESSGSEVLWIFTYTTAI